ncbi:MAG: hypothetical protein K2K80_03990 [Clostridia bacterium]|nr:hypothetical protein [Clostridia bacterium]
MYKLIGKTALKVLLAALIVLIVAFGILSLGYPAGLASFFEKSGNYSFASGYASLNYKYTGKIEDLERCFNDYVMSGNDENTVYYGEKLVNANNQGFATLCKQRDEELGINYRHMVYGTIACAKYRQSDKAGAVNSAKEAFIEGEGFPAANALVKLILAAEKDTVFLEEKIMPAMQEITPLDSQKEYYDRVVAIIEGLLS